MQTNPCSVRFLMKSVIIFIYLHLHTRNTGIAAHSCPSMCSCIWKNNKQTALCVNQGLISIPSGISSSTQVLDLNKNNFQILPAKVFQERGLIQLQKVFLSECKLGVIAPDAFFQLSHLIELYLSFNLLTSVPTEALKHCRLVRRLQINNNPIQAIRENSFDSLSHLMSLDLSNCEIDLIEPHAFRGLTSLQYMKLDGNRLTTLSSSVVVDLQPLFAFDLHNNPWNCDCELRASREWMYKNNVPQSIPPTCLLPERLSGSMWNSLDIDDFACTPNIFSRDSEVSAYELNANASFTCTIKAVPEPRVSWLVADIGNGNNSYVTLAELNEKYVITEESVSFGTVVSTLNILKVNSLDAGLGFRCYAENQAGTATKKFNLTLIAVTYNSLNGWSKVEIAAAVTAILIAVVVTCVLVVVCLLRKTRHFANDSETSKGKQLPQIDVLSGVKSANVTKNGTFDEKIIIAGNGKPKTDCGSSSAYGYTPDITANALSGATDNGYNNRSYSGLLQVSSQQHLPQDAHSYNNFENYDLYDYNAEVLNYNYDNSYANELPLASGHDHVDPNCWLKRSPTVINAGSSADLSQSPNIQPQHHVNVVGQGSYNIGHPTVVRYSPDEGYAEEPAIIPYNLQGTEV